LKKRQRKSWRLIRTALDEFIRELHSDQDNLVIFCADHGDNFGEQGWFYHFSNVTDAGNRVPLFWLGHNHPQPEIIDRAVSLAWMHNSILRACRIETSGETLFDISPSSLPILQSYWYDNHGKTLDKYKKNQFCFIHDKYRYLFRDKQWRRAPLTRLEPERPFDVLPDNIDPVEEMIRDSRQKDFMRRQVRDFQLFSEQILQGINR
jgi:arylsulfatase A-like enzyme